MLSVGPYVSRIKATETLSHYSHGAVQLLADHCDRINHAVVVVQMQKFRILKIRNSWGVNWGDGGYALVDNISHKNPLRACGLLDYAYQPRDIVTFK